MADVPQFDHELDTLDRQLAQVLAPGRSFMHLEHQYTTFSGSQVVVVPVPYDASTCYRPGAREGAQAIIDASRNLDLWDAELRRSPHRVGIHTLRAVEVVMGNAPAMVDRLELITSALLDRGKFVVTFGGDHMTSIGVIRAFAKRHPQMSVLQIDAHADLRDEYEGAKLSSATIMRRTLEVCPRTAQVGIRSLSEPEAELVAARNLPMWLASDIHAQTLHGKRGWIDEVVATLGDEVYITIDIDGFDPSLVPGTGTPEPGGLGWYDVIDLLTAVTASRKVIGFDLVELSPLMDDHVSPVVAAKLAYKLIGMALPEASEN